MAKNYSERKSSNKRGTNDGVNWRDINLPPTNAECISLGDNFSLAYNDNMKILFSDYEKKSSTRTVSKWLISLPTISL